MMRPLAWGLLLAGMAACMPQPGAAPDPQPAAAVPDATAADSATDLQPGAGTPGCLPDGTARFEAQLRGALEADVDWRDAQLRCDGDLKPDGSGLRLTMAGHIGLARPVRFILGIELTDAAEGPAQVLPTNLTVLVEGEALMYATRGAGKCAVEALVRTPLGDGTERVSGRGYCLDPASDLQGTARLLVPTFAFTTRVTLDAGPSSAPAAGGSAAR